MVGRAVVERVCLVALLAAVSLLLVARGTAAENDTSQAACPTSHVHYSPDATASAGLRSIPWIATAPTGMFHAHLFLYGGTPWPRLHLEGARIFTTVRARAINPKVLWTAQRQGAGATLLISGERLDKPGHFSARYPSAASPRNQFPSYVEVPRAGCWRVTVTSGKLVGAVTFAAVDSF